MRRRLSMGVVVAIMAAVAVALHWLPAERVSQAARASTPIEITLALRANGPAVEVEHGDLTLTLQF